MLFNRHFTWGIFLKDLFVLITAVFCIVTSLILFWKKERWTPGFLLVKVWLATEWLFSLIVSQFLHLYILVCEGRGGLKFMIFGMRILWMDHNI